MASAGESRARAIGEAFARLCSRARVGSSERVSVDHSSHGQRATVLDLDFFGPNAPSAALWQHDCLDKILNPWLWPAAVFHRPARGAVPSSTAGRCPREKRAALSSSVPSSSAWRCFVVEQSAGRCPVAERMALFCRRARVLPRGSGTLDGAVLPSDFLPRCRRGRLGPAEILRRCRFGS